MSLELNNIGVAYGTKQVLSNITTDTIKPGSLVALLGQNGAGKSTFVKSLAGLIPYQGHAYLEGMELAKMHQYERLKNIGYVPQTLPQGNSLLAYEVIKSATSALQQHNQEHLIEEVFERLSIAHLAFYPMHKLSGGQKQMISLAQTLVRHPKLYLLDEPTSALDLNWQMQVLNTIREEVNSQNSIALLISHDINLALRYCDQVILLHQGNILSIGNPKNSLTTENIALAYKVEARIETCSQGHPIVLVDKPI